MAHRQIWEIEVKHEGLNKYRQSRGHPFAMRWNGAIKQCLERGTADWLQHLLEMQGVKLRRANMHGIDFEALARRLGQGSLQNLVAARPPYVYLDAIFFLERGDQGR